MRIPPLLMQGGERDWEEEGWERQEREGKGNGRKERKGRKDKWKGKTTKTRKTTESQDFTKFSSLGFCTNTPTPSQTKLRTLVAAVPIAAARKNA